ncbi:MAG: hypothetical protein EOP62_03595 [Sphingomonadales bacterium]|nr:MAG: hypothetical protein EOP62_03595 [Sphingomonadales bacterium]
MRHALLVAVALSLPGLAHAQILDAPKCPIDKATYALKGSPEFTAGFGTRKHPMAISNLMFWVQTPKRRFWFEFQSPNGYGGTWITPAPSLILLDAEAEREDDQKPAPEIAAWEASTKESRVENDPLQNITFDAFSPDLASFEGPPQSDDPAPARIFMRGLGQALWYSWKWAAAGDAQAEQESIPTAMWEPSGCAK